MIGDDKYVNGNALSWGSFKIKVDGDELAGFFELSYTHKRTREKGYALGPSHAPTRRSKGKYEIENVKLKGYKASMNALRVKLAAAANSTTYGDTEFELSVQGVELNETPIDIKIERCVYAGVAATFTEGPELIVEEIDIDAMSMLENGLSLFDPKTV